MNSNAPKTSAARRPLSLSKDTVLAIRTGLKAGINPNVGGSSTTRAWCPSCCSTRVSSC